MKIREIKVLNILSLFDLLVVAVIVGVMAPVIYYYIKFNEAGFAEQRNLEKIFKQQTGYSKAYKYQTIGYIEVDASFKDVDKKNEALIQPGVKEILPDGTNLCEILWVGEPEKDYRYSADLLMSSKEFIKITMIGDKLSIPVKLRLKVVESMGTSMYDQSNVTVLNRFPFNIDGQ